MAPKRKKAVAVRGRNGARKKRNDKNTSKSHPPKKSGKRSAPTRFNNNENIPPPKQCRVGASRFEVLPTPIKALVDPNTYKLIKLSNGIRALLIHQPTKSKIPPTCSNRERKCKPTFNFQPTSFSRHPAASSSFDCETHEFKTFQKATNRWNFNFSGYPHPPRRLLPQVASNRPSPARRSKWIQEDKTSSLGVIVNVGSTADCEYRSGLAHFCEHLVHFGSALFPEEESHITFVKNKGDEFNAFTTAMITGYYHTLNDAFLEEGCQRMGEMLANPLFKSNMVKREVQALDNEFILHSHSDYEACCLILWSFARRNHPIRMFNCGNVNTLLPNGDGHEAVESLREDLVHFHHRYYVGSAITLAIQSTENIQNLEKMVVKHFENIPKGDKCIRKEMEIPEVYKNPFHTKEFNKFYFLNGRQSTPYLIISWTLPPKVWQDFRRKPFDFWGSLLGDERESGLAHQLRKGGYISDIIASVPEGTDFCRNEYCTIFEVQIVLGSPWLLDGKESLVEKVEAILEIIFQYIGRLRNMSHAQKTILWNEFATRNLSFEYSVPSEGPEFVQQCASALQILPEPEIFTGGRKVVPEYEDGVMSAYLNMLASSNMSVVAIIPAKILKKQDHQLLQGFREGYEKHTETTYWGKGFPKKLLTRLDCLLKNGTPTLIFPANPFHSGRTSSELSCVHRVAPQAVEGNAKCYVEHDGNPGSDWHLAECFVNIHSSAALFRFHHTNLCKLLLLEACLSRIVLPISCAAEKCGMQVGIKESGGSLKVQFIGFGEKLDLFVGEVLASLFPPEGQEGFPKHVFDIAKADVINNAINYLGTGDQLVASLFEELMTLGCPSFRNTVATLSSITYEHFLHFTKLYSNCSFVHVMMGGNVSLKTCQNLATLINGLNYYPRIEGWQKSLEFLSPETRMFPYDPRCLRVKSKYRTEKNSIVANFYQFMRNADIPSIYFLAVKFYMRAPYWKIMRMDAQLGYKVRINIGYLKAPFIYASVIFPANKRTLCDVDAAIDMFFVQFGETYLAILTEAEFQEQKLIWALPKTLTLQQVKDFYQKTFMRHMQPLGMCDDGPLEWTHAPGKIRKLSIQILGKEFERCKGTYAQCDTSHWTKPPSERKQPISFAADETPTAFPYFIKDPQWFRDGGNR